MTCSEIEIGDLGMLSYRLPVAPITSQPLNQHQAPRRSYSCLHESEASGIPLKWELTSRTQVLTNDPLGLLNPSPASPTSPPPNIVLQRTSSLLTKPFANPNPSPSPSETKATLSETTANKEDEVPSLLNIPTSITQLRTRLNQSGISALYNAKNFNTIKSFAMDRLSDLKTTVKSGTLPLTQSRSLYVMKNANSTKPTNLTHNNSNGRVRGSLSSLVSQQSSNSSSLNTNQFNGLEINHAHEDIKALRLDPSTVAIPLDASEHNAMTPTRVIEISSCNRCTACNQFLYDEEIMHGWSPDDSELHTTCVHCGQRSMPNLTIRIKVTRFLTARRESALPVALF